LVCRIFPIDLVKTRLQNHKGPEAITASGLVRRIILTEGWRGLYRGTLGSRGGDCFECKLSLGLLANLIGVAPEKAIKLAANDYFRSLFSNSSLVPLSIRGKPDQLPATIGALAGAMAGLAQVIATNPMEAVKIRMQVAASSLPSQTLVVPRMRLVVREMGLRGLYRGSLATLSRDIPFSMIFFQLFAALKQVFASVQDGGVASFPCVFLSGIVAGATGAFIVTPMDGMHRKKAQWRGFNIC
jgi:hypothetical protein